MLETEEKYISLLTDFGFKRIFGTKPNKDLLINFLNSLFEGEQVVTDVMYLNGENVGDVLMERKAIFDVYCQNEKGEKFIVEMQNAFQKHFKDRSIYYATYPIREQAKKGADWDFKLDKVYVIALLNFAYNDAAFKEDEICHDVTLQDKSTSKTFYDKLLFKYIEIGKFDKKVDELKTLSDKWFYALKNMARIEGRPKALKERIFKRLFQEAEIAQFTPSELRRYEDSLKAYRDIKNSMETAKEQGIEIGKERGIEIGKEQGIEIGKELGIEIGKELGIEIGKELGIEIGKELGIEIGKELGIEIGKELGIEIGKELGVKDGIEKVAKSMKERGIDSETIAACTGLSTEEVEKL